MKFKKPICNIGKDYSTFTLDTDKIERRSTRYNWISLPYTGPLPEGIEAHDSATVNIKLTTDGSAATLVLKAGKKKHRYSLEATPEELDGIAWSLFYRDCQNEKTGERWSETRFDCGLSKYWTGHLQALWMEWRKITREPDRLSDECIEAILKKVSTLRLEALLERREQTQA